MWGKLLCNVGVNQTVSLFQGTYRSVQLEGEAREMMKAAMRQDSKAGRKTEVALFAGTICELGKKHSIDTPVNDHFLEQFM